MTIISDYVSIRNIWIPRFRKFQVFLVRRRALLVRLKTSLVRGAESPHLLLYNAQFRCIWLFPRSKAVRPFLAKNWTFCLEFLGVKTGFIEFFRPEQRLGAIYLLSLCIVIYLIISKELTGRTGVVHLYLDLRIVFGLHPQKRRI